MKILKNAFLWAILCLSVFQSTWAQSPAAPHRPPMAKGGGKVDPQHQQGVQEEHLTPEKRAENRTQQMQLQLGLNEQQSPKVAAINQRMAKQIVEIRRSELSRYDKFSKIQALEQQAMADFRQILTPEQFKKLEAAKEKRDQSMEERQHQRRAKHQQQEKPIEERAAHRTTKMSQHLNLTDQQTALLKDLNLKHIQSMSKLRNDESLAKADRLKQLDEQKRQYENELQQILNAEQLRKAKEMKTAMKGKMKEKREKKRIH